MAKAFRKTWYVWLALLALVLMAAAIRYREDLFPPQGMIRSWTAADIAKEDYRSFHPREDDPLVCDVVRSGYFYSVSVRKRYPPLEGAILYKVDAYSGQIIGKMFSR